jgi:hypothetical protein
MGDGRAQALKVLLAACMWVSRGEAEPCSAKDPGTLSRDACRGGAKQAYLQMRGALVFRRAGMAWKATEYSKQAQRWTGRGNPQGMVCCWHVQLACSTCRQGWLGCGATWGPAGSKVAGNLAENLCLGFRPGSEFFLRLGEGCSSCFCWGR